MQARDIMTTNLVTCTRNTKLDEVSRLMARYQCGAVPVVENDTSRKVVGIITDRDIVCRALAHGLDPNEATAGACMTTHVFVTNQRDAIDRCLELMEQHHVRRIPVVDDSQSCCGVVTLTDLAEKLPSTKLGHTVREIEKPNLAALIPGNEPTTASERSIYGGIKPQFTAPSDLPVDITNGMPSTAMQLFYESYDGAMRELSAKDNPPEDLEKACTTIAFVAVKQKFEKVGDTWVPKGPKRD